MTSDTTSQSQTGDLTTIPEERTEDFTLSTKTGVSRAALRPAPYGSLSVRSMRLDPDMIPDSYTGPAVPDCGGTGIMRLPRYYPKYQPDTCSSPTDDTDFVQLRRSSLYEQCSTLPRTRRSFTAGPGVLGGAYVLRPIDERFEGRMGGDTPPELGSGRKFLVDEMDPDRKRLDIFDDGSTPVSTFHPSQRTQLAATQAAIYRSQKKELRARLKKEKQAARSSDYEKENRYCSSKCLSISLLVLLLIIGAALAIALGLYFGLRDSNERVPPVTESPRNQTGEFHSVPMAGTLVFRDYEYTSNYDNISSPQASAMSQSVCTAFYQVLIAVSSSRKSSRLESCSVNAFRNGSLWCDFSLTLSDYRSSDDDPHYQDLLFDVQHLIEDDVRNGPDSSIFHSKFPESFIFLDQLIVVTMPTTVDDVTTYISADTTAVTIVTTNENDLTASQGKNSTERGISRTSSTDNTLNDTMETVALVTKLVSENDNVTMGATITMLSMTSSSDVINSSYSRSSSSVQTTKFITTATATNISDSIATTNRPNSSSSSISSIYSKITTSISNIPGISTIGSSWEGEKSSTTSKVRSGSSTKNSITQSSASKTSAKSSDSEANSITTTTISKTFTTEREPKPTVVISTSKAPQRSPSAKPSTPPFSRNPDSGNSAADRTSSHGSTITNDDDLRKSTTKTTTPPFMPQDRTTTPGFEAVFSITRTTAADPSESDVKTTKGFSPQQDNASNVRAATT